MLYRIDIKGFLIRKLVNKVNYDVLRDLVPFVKFQKRENTHGESETFSKVAS